MVNCDQHVLRIHRVFRRDALVIGNPSGGKDRSMYRIIHAGRDDDAAGLFGEGVTNTGSQLSIEGRPGAPWAAVFTVCDVLRSSAIVCGLYDLGALEVPDLAHAAPQYLARGRMLGRADEVSSAVTIPGIWRASYWKRARPWSHRRVASDFGAATCRFHVESDLPIAALLARDGQDFGLRRAHAVEGLTSQDLGRNYASAVIGCRLGWRS